MKLSRLASLFLREAIDNDQLDLFLDRLLMRFLDSPAVITYLRDAQVRKPGDTREVEGDRVGYQRGQIELVFSQLPDEVIPQIAQITGISSYAVYRFRDPNTGSVHIGYVFQPKDSDLESGTDSKLDLGKTGA